MKIVVEYVLIENFCLNLIVLKTTAQILKEKGRRFWLSAFFCACLTVALPVARLNSVGWLLCEIGQTFITICLSFKFGKLKKFACLCLTYFLSNLFYGGACYFAQQLLGEFPIFAVLLTVTAAYFAISFVFKRVHRKKSVENFCFDVEFETGGNVTKWKAFLDSGNMLFDPVTNCPVSLINYKVFSALFKDIELSDILSRSEKVKSLKFAHYINFNTLGQGSKMLVFQVDKMLIAGHTYDNVTLGLSFKDFTFGTDVILHNNLAFT